MASVGVVDGNKDSTTSENVLESLSDSLLALANLDLPPLIPVLGARQS